MTDKLSLTSELAAQRRPIRHRWLWAAVTGLLLSLFLLGCLALSRLANTTAPDAMRLLSAQISPDGTGNFQIRLRVLRTDGKALGDSYSITADLLSQDGKRQVLGLPCNFQMDRQNHPKSVDVILVGRLPQNTKLPLPVQAQVRMRSMTLQEQLHFVAWGLSGRRLPQPVQGWSGFRTFTVAATLPPIQKSTASSTVPR